MADNGASKRTSKPMASAPSSMGGTSAPGIIFDYCPTDPRETMARAQAHPGHEAEADAAATREAEIGAGFTAGEAEAALAAEAAVREAEAARAAEAAAREAEAARAAEAAAREAEAARAAEAAAREAEAARAAEAAAREAEAARAAEAHRTARPFAPAFDLASASAAELSVKMIGMAQANLNASFDFVRRVTAAKSLAEVLELQSAYLQQQFAAMTAQTEHMAEFANKVASFSAAGDAKRRVS